MRFHDVLVVECTQHNQSVPIDPRFVEVCDRDSIEVIGHTCDKPVLLGAKVWGDEISVTFDKQQRRKHLRLVFRLSGIRRGFADIRFTPKTAQQFAENERKLQAFGV